MHRLSSSRLIRLAALLVLPLTGCVASTTQQDEPTASSQAASTVCGQTTVKGVDISHYDGTIDWTTVKSAGIDFAFAKATESTNFIDPTFATNWTGMKAAGVVRGAYHFFHPDVDAAMQASYCLTTVGALGADDLPVVLDFEELNGVAEATAVAGAVTFLAAVTKSTGKTAILYMSSAFLSGSYPALAPYPLWVANYGVTCPGVPSTWSSWTYWQDSATGSVAGISGASAVDLDFFNGTLQQLGGGGSSSGGGSGSGSGSGGGSGSGSGSGGGSGSGSGSGGGSGSGSGSGGGSGSSGGGGGSGGGSGSSSGTGGGSGGGSSGGGSGSSSGTGSGSGATVDAGNSGGGSGGSADGIGNNGNSGGCDVAPGARRTPAGVLALALGAGLVMIGRRRRALSAL
jgi:lysozyme